MTTITIGVDLAKNVFSVCSVNGSGRVLDRKDLRREAFSAYLVQLPAGSVVAMEACIRDWVASAVVVMPICAPC